MTTNFRSITVMVGLLGLVSGAQPKAAESKPIRTGEECREAGHTLVLDTGDGRTFRDDYRCPGGIAPVSRVRFGLEGGVCCPKDSANSAKPAPKK
jgi:hypothetical protein